MNYTHPSKCFYIHRLRGGTKMSYTTAENFRQSHGGSIAIKQFLLLLNTKVESFRHGKRHRRNLTLKEIAARMNLSASQVCRLRNGMFELQWVNQKGTQACIESEIQYLEREVRERVDFVEEQRKLQFIPGRINEQSRA